MNKKTKLIFGFQDTRGNKEDFALTPYLFLIDVKGDFFKRILGLGICWGYYAVYISVGINVPPTTKTFYNHSKKP